MRFPLVLAVALVAGSSESEPDPPIAFAGVDVLPMTGDGLLEDRTVVVRDGRIETIGPRTEIEVPTGARVIDGAGRTLMPGLADMHVHNWIESEHVLFLANGVTTIRNMFGSPLQLAWRDEIAAGERLGPTVYTAGPIVDGDPPVWPGSRVATTRDDGAAAVGEQVEAGYDFVKVYSRLPREAYEGVIDAAHRAGIAVDGHVPNAVGLEEALAAGQRTIEHLDGYETLCTAQEVDPEGGLEAVLRAWTDLDERKVAKAIERSTEAGVWNCVTLVVLQKMLGAEAGEAELERPCMRYVPSMTKSMWRGMANMRAPLVDAAQSGAAARASFANQLAEGGAKLLLGTDQGNPYVVAGFSIHDELQNLVDAGIAPYDALYAGTRAPAECLQATDEFGAVAAGLRADLVLVDGNPLDDIGVLREPVGVMVRGRWLPAGELHSMLEELATEPPPDAKEPPRLEVRALANEGFLLRAGDDVVALDPFVTEPYSIYAALEGELREALENASGPFAEIDVAITSHHHRDHLQRDAAQRFFAAHPDCALVGSPQVLKVVDVDLPDERVHAVFPEPGASERLTIDEIEIEVLHLSHGSGRFANVQNAGHLITLGGVTALHLGDAAMDPASFDPYGLAAREIDVVFVPYWYFDDSQGERIVDELFGSARLIACHVPPADVERVARALERTRPDVVVPREPMELVEVVGRH